MEEGTKFEPDDSVNYKYTKNKRLSLYRTAKNQRRYNADDWQKKKHKKKNWKRNHFEKSSVKKKASREHFEHQVADYYGRAGFYRGLYKHRQQRLYSRSSMVFIDVPNRDFEFHHKLKHLLSIKQDAYLNKNIFIKYFADRSARFQARLTSISNCGQYRIEAIVYRGGSQNDYYKRESLGILDGNYWFHMNSTRKIYIDNCECNKALCQCHDELDYTEQDITLILMDIIKFKVINYFLFICAFKEKEMEHSPLKYLIKQYFEYQLERVEENNQDISDYINILKAINRERLQQCSFCDKLCKQFVYGRKQNEFDYLSKQDWNKKPTYFHAENLLELLYNYKELIVKYLEHKNKMIQHSMKDENKCYDDESKVIQKVKQNNLSYLDWDEIDIKKTTKSQKEENRTV